LHQGLTILKINSSSICLFIQKTKTMKTKIQLLIIFSVTLIMYSCKKDAAVDPRPTDIDGNVYDTVIIGTQVWMKQNLRTTRYNDGTAIPTGLSDLDWRTATTAAYAIYDNDAANDITYGKLYNWYAVGTGKLAPAGWHIPTDAEWTTLTDYLGGDAIAGDKMKTTTLWTAYPGLVNTNSSGFTGLPGGARSGFFGTFGGIENNAEFWSTTEFLPPDVQYLSLNYNQSNTYRNHLPKDNGLSVRCVRD
jgi:uncharacterized protein (TIGR02145 family)